MSHGSLEHSLERMDCILGESWWFIELLRISINLHDASYERASWTTPCVTGDGLHRTKHRRRPYILKFVCPSRRVWIRSLGLPSSRNGESTGPPSITIGLCTGSPRTRRRCPTRSPSWCSSVSAHSWGTDLYTKGWSRSQNRSCSRLPPQIRKPSRTSGNCW